MQIEEVRGKVLRGRIGIQPSYNSPLIMGEHSIATQFHIGHARTLLLGSLICERLEIPLWIRFKWGPGAIPKLLDMTSMANSHKNILLRERVLIASMCQTAECASWLGVEVSRFFVPVTTQDMPTAWVARINRIVLDHAEPSAWANDPKACWYDDAVLNWPFVFIRGADWAPPFDRPGVDEYIAFEDLVFQAAGHEKYQITLPAIMVGAQKMSTSTFAAVSWELLKPFGREKAKEWLLRGIDLDNLPGESTQWSYDEWTEALVLARKK